MSNKVLNGPDQRPTVSMGIIIYSLLSLEFLGSEHIFGGAFFVQQNKRKVQFCTKKKVCRGGGVKELRTKLSAADMEPRQAKSVWVPEGEPGR